VTRTDDSRHTKLYVESEFLQTLQNTKILTAALRTELLLRSCC